MKTWEDFGFKMVDGEILDTDKMFYRLFYLTIENPEEYETLFAVPVIAYDDLDVFLTVQYDPNIDEFVDALGYPIFRESWIQDYKEWVLMESED